jgi:hypothetical protein
LSWTIGAPSTGPVEDPLVAFLDDAELELAAVVDLENKGATRNGFSL